MRAGLLSDPRVVAVLRELFVPVHISALNTPHCLRDPRDAELLRASIRDDTDDFDGGEREAFVMPDGRMTRVFLSLHGYDAGRTQATCSHYTAAARREEVVVGRFRANGEQALLAVAGVLPPRWRELWDADHPDVRALAAAAPIWPMPTPGTSGFRVFSRNSYRQYDDLHGVEVATIGRAEVAAWLGQLRHGRAVLPRAAFVRLARAMVPRGQVDTELREDSIAGELVLVAGAEGPGAFDRGRVEGWFELAPRDKAEVAKRLNAACRFRSKGRLVGTFALAPAGGDIACLRVVATDVEFAWLPGYRERPESFPHWHRVAFEWVAAPL